jgi:thiol-disulfide isomerase/thioredoxin
MRGKCTLGLTLALLLGGGLTARPAGETAAPRVEVEVVKYDGLGAKVRQHKGKVVVVDFWATWCQPCKKEFPHLVELSQKHAADGLVAVSVSVDNLDKQEAVRKFDEFRPQAVTMAW